MIITETGARLPTVTEAGIFGFFGDYRFLSNFHVCRIEYEGLVYGSTEAAYMAAKSEDMNTKMRFTKMTPNKARAQGQLIQIRDDWEDIKADVMHEINKVKYADPELMKLLKATGNKWLEETNNWRDKFWGVHVDERGMKHREGMNMLGRVLMLIRDYPNADCAIQGLPEFD